MRGAAVAALTRKSRLPGCVSCGDDGVFGRRGGARADGAEESPATAGGRREPVSGTITRQGTEPPDADDPGGDDTENRSTKGPPPLVRHPRAAGGPAAMLGRPGDHPADPSASYSRPPGGTERQCSEPR
ncbi:hypothetical protein GCM10010250_32050 [Streptomyces althioticus]|nr:hypothetical protein GCM10010250_32050 [Streptomyces althioticus]